MVFKTAKNFFLNRIIPILLIGLILVLSVPQTAFASSTTDNSSSEADPIGSSLYDITTALSAYASNVIGPNANDPQDDSSANTDSGGNSHKITMLESTGMGNAGCIVGYTDATQDKTYLMVGNNRGASTANYQAYQYIGDNGHTYEYVRYGRLLSQLGLDEVGNEASPGARTVAGLVMEGVHLFAQIVPAVFDFSLGVLDFLNPFRFLVNEETTTTALKGVGTGRRNTGTIANPFSANGSNEFEESNTYIYEGQATASDIGGSDETNLESDLNNQSSIGSNTVQNLVSNNIFTGITNITTSIYIQLRAIGMWIVLPLALAFFLAGILLTRRGRMPGQIGGRILRFMERFLFILLGVPLLGLMYTSLLESINEKIDTDEPTSRVIACTFSNFAGWVEKGRLAVPSDGGSTVTLVSEITDDSGSAGVPSADSYRTTRETVYQVNYHTILDKNDNPVLNANSGLGLSTGNSDVTGGTYDENGLITKQDAGDTSTMFSQLNSLISTYQEASFYAPSSWESNIDAVNTGKHLADMGSAGSTDQASTNTETIYQMYHDTDEVGDWMDRGPDNNKAIFLKTKGTENDRETSVPWAYKDWNIFANGSDYGLGDGVDSNQDPVEELIYKSGNYSGKSASNFWGSNAVDPAYTGGLSTVSMYNYLSSVFDENQITVYSALTTTSEYTKQQHYAVTIAGSGALGVVFAFNGFAVLFVYVFLAFGYAFGMAWHVLKQGFTMLIHIPAAILGAIRSIVQVILLVVGMILEILVTILIYEIVMEVIFSIASLVEQPIMNFVENLGNSASNAMSATAAGGLMANTGEISIFQSLADSTYVVFIGIIIASLLVVAIGFTGYKLNRAFLTGWAYAWQKLYGLLIYDEWKDEYWKLMAEESSLYIWDDLAIDVEDLSNSLRNHQSDNDIQIPAVEGGTA